MKKTYKPFDPKAKTILIQGHYDNFIMNLKWYTCHFLAHKTIKNHFTLVTKVMCFVVTGKIIILLF